MPSAFDATNDGLIRNVLDSGNVVVVNVTLVDNTLDLVLGLAQPALFNILEDNLETGLLARNEAGIGYTDVEITWSDGSVNCHNKLSAGLEITSQEATQVCSGMGKVVRLVIPVVQRDVDSLIVNSRSDTNTSACELGADLVEATGRNALLWTVDIVSGDGRMVRGLLGEVRDLNWLSGSIWLDFVALDHRDVVLDLPLTLGKPSERVLRERA